MNVSATSFIIYLALTLLAAMACFVFGYSRMGRWIVVAALVGITLWAMFNRQSFFTGQVQAETMQIQLQKDSGLWEQGTSLGVLKDLDFNNDQLVIKTDKYIMVVKGVPAPLQRGSEVRRLEVGGKDKICVADIKGPMCFGY